MSHEYVSIIVGTVLLCAVLYAFFTYTRVGVAMQAASQNQLAAYYMGIPVKRMFSLIWAISAGVAAIAGRAAGAGVADRHQPRASSGSRPSRRRCWAASAPSRARWSAASPSASSSCSPAPTCRRAFKDVAAYVVLLLVLAVRPQGMFGTVGRKKV